MLSQAASAQAAEKAVIAGYNAKLVQRVAAFEAAHPNVCFIIIAMICIGYGGSDATPQVTTKIWDSNTAFTTVLDSPKTFGFVDATSFGNPGDFWGYVLHIRTQMYAVLTISQRRLPPLCRGARHMGEADCCTLG